MTTVETIAEHLRTLPDEAQREVLDFVVFIKSRQRQVNTAGCENEEWTGFSLASAMSGVENEESPYTLADLKESFK